MLRRFVVLIAATLPLAVAVDIRVVEEIAAKVNGDIITRGELEQTRKEIENEAKKAGLKGAELADAVKQAQGDALRDQIDQLLLVQHAKDINISVDPEITRYVARLQVQAGISDPDKFAEAIRQQYGVTLEDLKLRQKNNMLAERVVSGEIGSRINIPEADQRAYYEANKERFVREEQVFLSQLLISTEGKTLDQAAAAEKKAKELVARARMGEKFSELVTANSDDPEATRTNGFVGGFKRADMAKDLADIVFAQKKGFVTDPIRRDTPKGFVIFKVEERYDAGQASFEEVRSEIQNTLAEPKMRPKVREFLTKLRNEAFLEIREGYVDSGAAPGKDTGWHDVAQIKPQTTTKEEVAARKRKKFLWIIPHGRVGPAKSETAAQDVKPTTTPKPVEKEK
jgi:peptidyl-prolyl cis-trans isomerase SurA